MLDRRKFLAAASALIAWPAKSDANPPMHYMGSDGRYLPWFNSFITDPHPVELVNYYKQQEGQIRCMLGDERGAFNDFYSIDGGWPAVDMSNTRSEPAIEAIVREAKGRRLVVLNEAHHVSRCRSFARRVVLRLRQEGFSLFAAEALNTDRSVMGRLNAGKAIDTEMGFYVRDPGYAETLRVARDAGYRFVAYEQTETQEKAGDGVGVREEDEASNLAAVMGADPEIRALVYCGYGHVAKTLVAGGIPWFAARLARKLRIDPLCVTQVDGVPPPSKALESLFLRGVLDHFEPNDPIVAFRGSLPLTVPGFEHAVDLAVYQPRLPNVNGRPGWLAAEPDRRRVTIDLPEAVKVFTLVQAVPEAELAQVQNVVPADQYPPIKGSTQAILFLRPGKYRIRLETLSGRIELKSVVVS